MRNIIYPLPALALMSALAISSNASEYPGRQEKFSGLFTGLSLDYKQSSTAVKKTFIGTGGPFTTSTGQKTKGDLSAKSAGGNINIGFGSQWNCTYFGLSIGASLYNLVKHLTINKGTRNDYLNNITRLKSNYAADAAFRYGYIFGKVMPYIQAGAAFSKFKIRTNYPSLATLASRGIHQTHQKKKKVAGLVAELGVDFKYSSHVVLGGYATYRQFKEIKYQHPLLERAKITPSDLSVGLKVNYLF